MTFPVKKSHIIRYVFVCAIVFNAAALYAVRDRSDYFLRPQVGGWFGPVTPILDTAHLVDTALSGGIFFRYNTMFSPFKLGVDSSYQNYKSKGVNQLTLVPIYGSLLYLLPIDLPLRFQLKAGAGGCYVYILPDKYGQWDPVFMFGFEVSFPAGRIVNIGLRIDYLLIYEGYIKGSRNNGHVINAGIMLYFNI